MALLYFKTIQKMKELTYKLINDLSKKLGVSILLYAVNLVAHHIFSNALKTFKTLYVPPEFFGVFRRFLFYIDKPLINHNQV